MLFRSKVSKTGEFITQEADQDLVERVTTALENAGFEAEKIGTEDCTVNTEEASEISEDVSSEEEETEGLTISLPRTDLTEMALTNLKALIASKATLIKKALNADSLEIEIDDEKISFPWWNELPTSEEVAVYSEFMTALVKMARTAKRVTAVEKPVESEKYAFRVFLLRLGFSGAEHKKTRSILLKRLSGHSAFPTKAAADAFYARQKEKKAKLAVITEAPAEAVEPEEVTEE